MKWELVIAGLALFITVVVNIATIAYFAGILKSNQENQKEAMQNLKDDFKENLKNLKENFEKTLENLTNDFKGHFVLLEKKQDKYNGVIEKTYKNERDISVLKEQVKVENHRIEDLERLN